MKSNRAKFTVLLSEVERKMLEELAEDNGLRLSNAMCLRSLIRAEHRKRFGARGVVSFEIHPLKSRR